MTGARNSTTESTSTNTRIESLDEFRPPQETLIHSYDMDGEWIELDEPIRQSELPDGAERGSHTPSLAKQNEEHEWVIVHERIVRDEPIEGGLFSKDMDESGYIALLAPEYDSDAELFWKTADEFDTWGEAEAYIAEHFDQPDADNEVIRPMHADHVHYDIQTCLLGLDKGDTDILDTFFYGVSPADDEFWP